MSRTTGMLAMDEPQTAGKLPWARWAMDEPIYRQVDHGHG